MAKRPTLTAFLRAFKNQYVIYVEAETDFLITVDEVGRVVYVNPAVEKRLERKKEQFINHEIVQFINENDLSRFIHSFDKSREPEPIRFLKWGSGEVSAVMLYFIFQQNEDNKLFGYLLFRPVRV